MKNHIEVVLDYILDNEIDDFNENPSNNHIYFHALVVRYGIKNATNELNKQIKFLSDLSKIRGES